MSLTRWLTSLFVVVSCCTACPPVADEGEGEGGEGEEGEGEEGEGDEGEGEGEGDGVEVGSVEDFCAGVHGAVCGGFVDCGCDLDGRDFDAADCVDVRVAQCTTQVQQFVDAGAVVAKANADACIAGIAALAASCTIVEDRTLPPICAGVFIENVDIGDPCVLPLPCAGGDGGCFDGVCAALPGEGVVCPAGRCALGLVCNDAGRCVGPDAVVPGGAGDACADVDGCAAGLVCDAGVCAAGPARGSACAGPVCGSGDACVREFDNRVCGAPVVDGGDCLVDAECAGGFCSSDRVCAPLPGDGDICPDRRCADGLVCDENDVVCVVPPGDGEACLIGNAACAAGLGCNSDNVCVPGPDVGEACLIPNNLCADGLGCDFTPDGSICAVRRGVDADCQSDVCEAGLFCDFTTATCQPLRAVGTPCPDGGGCGVDDECGDLLGGFRCVDVPDVAGASCFDSCGGGFACVGDGGVCAPSICASR